MTAPRGLLVLAIAAALCGAPSSVFAAANELSAPQVSPPSGTATTLFAFRVRYEGTFAAVSVSVEVADATVPMTLQGGSLTAGWWAGSSLLPSGAWATSFRATSSRGPSAAIAGPIVTVAAPAMSSPTPGAVAAPSSGPEPEAVPEDGAGGPTAPPAAPAPSPEEAAATTAVMASAEPEAPGGASGPGGSGGSDAPAGGSVASAAPGRDAGDAGDAGDGGDAPDGQDAVAASPGTSRDPDSDSAPVRPVSDADTPRSDPATADETVSEILLFGLAGVASVAIIGTLLLVAGRRREPEPAAVSPAPTVADDALMRRMARSGRSHAADDPIVAALGVDDEMAARRAIRRAGRQVRDGTEHPAGDHPNG